MLVLLSLPCECNGAYAGLRFQILGQVLCQIFIAGTLVNIPFVRALYAYCQADIAVDFVGCVIRLLKVIPTRCQRVGIGYQAADIGCRSLYGGYVFVCVVPFGFYCAAEIHIIVPPIVPHPLREVHIATVGNGGGDGIGIGGYGRYRKGIAVCRP